MVDMATVKYRVFVIDSKKHKYNITDYLEDLSWEEGKGEISMRVTFTLRNDLTPKGHFIDIIQKGCLILVTAKDGSRKYTQVARGIVVTQSPTYQSSSHNFKFTCYDELYNLQKSQDNFYFKSGTGTKARVKAVMGKWKVPLGRYEGPDKKHGKKKYQNKYLSDILLDILEDAKKKGGRRCILRCSRGKAEIVPLGENSDIYVFLPNNTVATDREYSIADLVTRVKVVGSSKDGSKSKAVATVDGHTKYGIRQRIYTRGSDESVAEAKKAAKEILDESGHVKKEATVRSPDVPYLRKGDMVYVDVGAVEGYYYIIGIMHDAGSASMTMELEPADKNNVSKNKTSASKDFKAGDIVSFEGGTHYVSSSSAKGYPAKAGKARITQKNSSGKHPYHLIHADGKAMFTDGLTAAHSIKGVVFWKKGRESITWQR